MLGVGSGATSSRGTAFPREVTDSERKSKKLWKEQIKYRSSESKGEPQSY